MYCKACQVKMREERRTFHKQRKWLCPACGRARMQAEPLARKATLGRKRRPVHDSGD